MFSSSTEDKGLSGTLLYFSILIYYYFLSRIGYFYRMSFLFHLIDDETMKRLHDYCVQLKSSLVRGHEDFEAAISVLKRIRETKVTLIQLARTWELADCVKKVREGILLILNFDSFSIYFFAVLLVSSPVLLRVFNFSSYSIVRQIFNTLVSSLLVLLEFIIHQNQAVLMVNYQHR